MSKNYSDYFLDRFWKYLGYFLFKHLVTLVANCPGEAV